MDKKSLNALDKLIEKAKETIAKKLTTKTRKALPKSAFCGPGRSFPVHDCAHVRAAKAYLNRSRFSKSTKQKIAACINRKAKALGCPGTKPAKAKGGIDEELANLMETEIFESTKEIVKKSIEPPDMDLSWEVEPDCNDCEEKKEQE